MRGRLQHRQLPRRGSRQGRLHSLAVRLRSGWRLQPHHARNRLPTDQPGAAARKPADGKGRSAPCRIPAASGLPRTASTTTRFSVGSKPASPHDPAEVASSASLEIYPPKVVLEGEGATQQFIARAKYSGRHRPRRDEPGRVPDEQRQLGADRCRRPGHGGRSRRGFPRWPASTRLRLAARRWCCRRTCSTTRPTRRRRTTSTSW